jgi:outer membrane receptor protein involved in Fe transport
LPGGALAGTTGKITGAALDRNQKPVPGVTVMVVGTRLGAFTDLQGVYNILNVPPGSYDLKVSHVAYKPLLITGVQVSADNTTRQDISVEETAVAMEQVEVKAARPLVDVNLTSSRSTVSDKVMAALPVQELQDVVNLQAGVVDGHMRGGRLGEVQYQVDGVSVNNAYDNKASLRLDQSILQEVQIISGVFDAEYGQAMSGVVNAVLKDGTDRFEWGAEIAGGGYFFPERDNRLIEDRVQPGRVQNYQMNVSGPVPLAKTNFLLSGQRRVKDDFIVATREYVPTDTSDFEHGIRYPTGDGKQEPLGEDRQWSGVAKITNRSIPNVSLSYQAIVNSIEGRRSNYSFIRNPDGLTRQETWSITHGIDVTHTMSKSTFYNFGVRQNYLHYTDYVYSNFYDHRYDDAGPPRTDWSDVGVYIQGVDLNRFEQKTDALVVKGAISSQTSSHHLVKVGGEAQFPKISFGVPGHLDYTTGSLVRHINEPPDYPGVQHYQPVLAATYAQDQMEWSDLTIRLGGRLEYFDARAKVPSDPANPANSIAGAPASGPRPTTRKVSFAPRLGVAYPITDRSGVHFAYGHFYQLPGLGDIFSNANYAILNTLQASGSSRFGVLGNPDVKPEKTVQYELGYKYALSEQLGFDFSIFYKDIRDLLGIEFISTYNDAEYSRLTNSDFGNVIGLTMTLNQRQIAGPISTVLDYTFQRAEGNSSDPRETATREENGEDPRPRQIPLNWDQRHSLNLTILADKPSDFTAALILRVASGQPYTPDLFSGFGGGLGENSGRKPASMVVDLRGAKLVRAGGMDMSLFGKVYNLFDTRFFNGAVFGSTGSPYYTRFPAQDVMALKDPSRYYSPRRIEVGFRVGSQL